MKSAIVQCHNTRIEMYIFIIRVLLVDISYGVDSYDEFSICRTFFTPVIEVILLNCLVYRVEQKCNVNLTST